jgi:hypothetical protein
MRVVIDRPPGSATCVGESSSDISPRQSATGQRPPASRGGSLRDPAVADDDLDDVEEHAHHGRPGSGVGPTVSPCHPLLLDDEEAVAVAVGLRAAARTPVDGIEEASARALSSGSRCCRACVGRPRYSGGQLVRS